MANDPPPAVPPIPPVPPLADAQADERLKQLRAAFTPFFFSLVRWTFVLVALSVIGVLFITTTTWHKGGHPETEAAEKALLAQTIQSSLGMVLGLVIVALGVAMTWVAIEAPFTLAARGTDASNLVTLQSVSPGIALIVGGQLLIGFSLYLPMHYVQSTGDTQRVLERYSEGPN
jgi:hypothetical protein